MACSREELERREREFLAPYAQFSAETRGRRHSARIGGVEFRTHYQRDRDRVIHSRAFRRLEYKTQVFLNGTGDHLRTRLTHTMEVVGIARNIARALRLNEDLTETIALAHDLGHAPFGHKGEEILNELMKDDGGFEHNLQSLRIVEEIERKYPHHPGLNLTWETREGLIKHRVDSGTAGQLEHPLSPSRSLEAEVANLADEIAYYSHDLDDGIESGLLNEENLRTDVAIWREAAEAVQAEFGDLPDECRRYFTIRCIIDAQVTDVVRQAEQGIADAGIRSVEDVRNAERVIVAYGPERARKNQDLRNYLYQNLYYSPEVRRPNDRAASLLVDLFEHYLKNPGEIDNDFIPGETAVTRREVCDYVAGMTDRFALLEHARLFGSSQLTHGPIGNRAL